MLTKSVVQKLVLRTKRNRYRTLSTYSACAGLYGKMTWLLASTYRGAALFFYFFQMSKKIFLFQKSLLVTYEKLLGNISRALHYAIKVSHSKMLRTKYYLQFKL